MRQRLRRRRARAIAEGTAVFVVLAAAAYGVTHIPPFPSIDLFSVSNGREHLDPIPIDRGRACVHVKAIHAELNRFQSAYTAAMFGFDQASSDAATATSGTVDASTIMRRMLDPAQWPLVKAELGVDAQQLDAAIVGGIATFPPRIQRELRAVRDALARGRVLLVGTHDAAEMDRQTSDLFRHGQAHVGWAGDLVGRQCRVPLAATD